MSTQDRHMTQGDSHSRLQSEAPPSTMLGASQLASHQSLSVGETQDLLSAYSRGHSQASSLLSPASRRIAVGDDNTVGVAGTTERSSDATQGGSISRVARDSIDSAAATAAVSRTSQDSRVSITGRPASPSVAGSSTEPRSINTTQLMDSEELWRELSQSAATGRTHEWVPSTADNVLQAFADVYETECSVPLILPYWLAEPENLTRKLDRESLQEFMRLWAKSKDLAENTPISLDPVTRLTRRLNSAANESLNRLVEVYNLVRLRKLLREPQAVLDIMKENAAKEVFGEREVRLAQKLVDYATERDWDLPETTSAFVHIRCRDPEAKLATLVDRSYDEDPMLDYITRALQERVAAEEAMGQGSDGTSGSSQGPRIAGGAPSHIRLETIPAGRTTVCYTSDVFWYGLLKGRLSGCR